LFDELRFLLIKSKTPLWMNNGVRGKSARLLPQMAHGTAKILAACEQGVFQLAWRGALLG
jgi:hypothetical protein